MKVDLDIPEGKSGNWSIEHFTLTPADAENARFRALIHGDHRFVPAGDYVRLMRGDNVIMSNTPDEIRDHREFARRAERHVLINGLGLGMVIEMVIGSVDRVTVVEKSEDVIALSAAHYLAKYPNRVEIIHADAFDWQPPKGVRYTAVWHDIWDNLCTDNLPEMARLHRKYGRRCDWQGSWSKEWCLYYRSREQRWA